MAGEERGLDDVGAGSAGVAGARPPRRPRRARPAVWIVALVAGILLPGCSGDEREGDAAQFVQRPESRLVKVQTVGVAAFGPIVPHAASASVAASAFGEPASVARHRELCRRRWPVLGLTIDFSAPSGADPCGEQAGIESITVAGPAAAKARWRTAEGIRPGMSVAAARRIYPDAHRGRSGALVLVEPPDGTGSDEAGPVLAVTTAHGRVDALVLPIGAG